MAGVPLGVVARGAFGYPAGRPRTRDHREPRDLSAHLQRNLPWSISRGGASRRLAAGDEHCRCFGAGSAAAQIASGKAREASHPVEPRAGTRTRFALGPPGCVAGHEAHRRRNPVDDGTPGLGRAQVLDLGGCEQGAAIGMPVRLVRWCQRREAMRGSEGWEGRFPVPPRRWASSHPSVVGQFAYTAKRGS